MPPFRLLAVAALTTLLALAGCSTGQDIQPRIQALDTQKLGVEGAQPEAVKQDLSAWWEAYGDARLSALVQQALAGKNVQSL